MGIFYFVCVGVLLAIIFTYNGLVSAKNGVENAQGALDAMLKKRYDVLPNLIAIANSYMNYEKNTLTELTTLCTQRAIENATDTKNEIDNKVGQVVNNVLVSVENYPNLKTDRVFIKLLGAWNESEEQIAAARRAYNAAVEKYNNAFERYPGSMLAGKMKFEHKKPIEVTEEEASNVDAAKFLNTK